MTTQRDWIFLSFCAFAGVMLVRSGINAAILAHVARGGWVCLADNDAPCVEVALDRARSVDPEDPRARALAVAVALQRKDVAGAESALKTFVERGSLDSTLRANLLLLEGDVAAAGSNSSAAHEKYAAGRRLLDDDRLVLPRLDRLKRSDEATTANAEGTVMKLRTSFDGLFDSAEAGQTELATIRVSEINLLIARVKDAGLRQQLQIGIQTAQRTAPSAEAARRQANMAFARAVPRPVEPSRPVAVRWPNAALAQQQYERALVDYENRLEQWRRAENEADRLSGEVVARNARSLTEARSAVSDALDKLTSHPELVSITAVGP